MEDILTIAFDSSLLDIPILTIGRRDGTTMNILHQITGEEAIELYKKLTNKTSLERGNKNE